MENPETRLALLAAEILKLEVKLDQLLFPGNRTLTDYGEKLRKNTPMPSQFYLPALMLPVDRLDQGYELQARIAALQTERTKALVDMSQWLEQNKIPAAKPDITPLPDNLKVARGEGDLPQWK